MPTWLSDPPNSLDLVLGILFVAALGVWVRGRKRGVGIVAVVFGLLFFGLIMLDIFLESPREESIRKVNLMVKHCNDNDWPKLAEHLSKDFKFNGFTQDGVKVLFDRGQQFGVKVSVWDFDKEQVRMVSDDKVEIEFNAKGEAMGKPFPTHIKAIFVREGGQFRALSFETFDIIDRRKRLDLPGVP
jgi:hypothetical protein